MWRLALGITVLGYGVSLGATQSTGSPATIWDGTYTAAQADRGKAQFNTYCSSCHQEDLSGANGPPLVGKTFLISWDSASVGELHTKIRRTMPRRQPSLPDNVYPDLVAYILQVNGFPTGAAELQLDASGMNARIVSKDGPVPPQDGDLVRTVGCFTGDRASGWRLASASVPVRARNPEASAAADLSRAAAEAPGTRSFVLKAVDPGADSLKGQRVEAKGLITGESIALMSLAGVGTPCAP